MLPIIPILLIITFLVSIAALLILIWSLSKGHFNMGPESAKILFANDEVGSPEDPTLDDNQLKSFKNELVQVKTYPETSHTDERKNSFQEIDLSTYRVTKYLLISSIFWLVLGSIFGVMTSFKFNYPDWLTNYYGLTFGVLRPLHLSSVIYGWLSMAGLGVSIWMVPRLVKTKLRMELLAIVGTHIWNFGMVLGLTALFFGFTDGLEWLEFPWAIDMLFVISGAMIGIPILTTIKYRNVGHLYVSVWYIGAALVWFPILFFIANFPGVHFGVEHAIVNWWFAHNVLGLWLTPFGLSAAYYFIPKILGRPIHSYQLSLLGFWSLALFYSQVGVHHLIGGPVPTWLVTLSIVTSVMMIIPVLAVAINHHMTVWGYFRLVPKSPTLLFIVTGAMFYTLTSFQGSLQSLRAVNQLFHFTHATVAHAHMGVYGFVSMIMFGSFYFILPRITGFEWPKKSLIKWHYIFAVGGFLIYFIFLSYGGLIQGLEMLDINIDFDTIVKNTRPYLYARSIGGTFMMLSHFIFAYHVWAFFKSKNKNYSLGRI
jgi:cytochrome c oxidase cbb3-type subunit 1